MITVMLKIGRKIELFSAYKVKDLLQLFNFPPIRWGLVSTLNVNQLLDDGDPPQVPLTDLLVSNLLGNTRMKLIYSGEICLSQDVPKI